MPSFDRHGHQTVCPNGESRNTERQMFGAEKEPAGIDGSQGGDEIRDDVSAKAYLRVGVIERSPVKVEQFSDSGATTYTWP
jgi:hypothetical protein